jgi:hypothetical protein
MRPLPATEHAPVLRTDFADQAAWDAIGRAIRAPVDGFLAYVTFVDDAAYDGVGLERLPALLPERPDHAIVIVADGAAMSHPEHPLLVVDALSRPLRSFRAVPGRIQGVENNLSIANMDFAEFAEAVDDDGIFRGFRDG